MGGVWKTTDKKPACWILLNRRTMMAVVDNMSLLAALLLMVYPLQTAGCCGGPSCRSLVFNEPSSDSYVEMTPKKPLNLTAFSLCMRLATELSADRTFILFAYRTQPWDELNVWHYSDGSKDGVFFQLPQLGAIETHLCVTWDSSSGLTAFYMDGKKSLSKIYKKGHKVQPGGRVIIGQDPDKLLGSFRTNQSFVGEIGDINMWDYVLCPDTIKALYAGQRVARGNIFDWDTVVLQANGRAEVVDNRAQQDNAYQLYTFV